MAIYLSAALNQVYADGSQHLASALAPKTGPITYQSGTPRYSRRSDNNTLIDGLPLNVSEFDNMLYQRNAINLEFNGTYAAQYFTSGWYPVTTGWSGLGSPEVSYSRDGIDHNLFLNGSHIGVMHAWYDGGVVDVYGNVITAASLRYVNITSRNVNHLINAFPGNTNLSQPILGYWDIKPEITVNTTKTVDVSDGADAGIYCIINNRGY